MKEDPEKFFHYQIPEDKKEERTIPEGLAGGIWAMNRTPRARQ